MNIAVMKLNNKKPTPDLENHTSVLARAQNVIDQANILGFQNTHKGLLNCYTDVWLKFG